MSNTQSAARAKAFNRQNVEAFHQLVADVYSQYNIKSASQVFNFDETSTSNPDLLRARVVAPKGAEKPVCVAKSVEYATLHTIEFRLLFVSALISEEVTFPCLLSYAPTLQFRFLPFSSSKAKWYPRLS
jgi:hypothetical protein